MNSDSGLAALQILSTSRAVAIAGAPLKLLFVDKAWVLYHKALLVSLKLQTAALHGFIQQLSLHSRGCRSNRPLSVA